MLTDLLHLSRSLRRSPASAGAAILTLSLTLGAGTAVFAVIHAVLLTPPAFRDPDALVSIGETPLGDPTAAPRSVPYSTFEAWRERAGSLAVLEASDGTNLTLTGLGPAERLTATDVTPGFLTLLGVVPALGRGFDPEDVGRPIVLVSHAFWQGRLAGDPDVIGRQIVLGGQPHAIVGVLPEQFVWELNSSDIWRPLPLTPPQAARAGYRVGVLGRLAPNVSPASLSASLDDISGASSPPARAVVTPLATAISSGAAGTLVMLGGAAALAMLIAFANFAALLIVRAIDRQRELAIRSALGAGRSEPMRQLMLEAQVLVLAGIGIGVLLALWLTPLVALVTLEQFGVRQRDVAVSWGVIGVVAVAASVCAWISAWWPARLAARRSVLDIPRRGATPAPHDLLLRRVLVSGEVALAFVLLASVTLLGGSLLRLLESNPGFHARGVLTMQISVPSATYDLERVVSFYTELQQRLEERLGPRSVAIINEIPLSGSIGRSLVGLRPADAGTEAVVREAGPAYFDVMRIPMLAGRSFEPRDDGSAPVRVVLSESLAERLFGSEPPVGRQLWLAAPGQMAEVIGVAGDVRHRALDEPVLPTAYLAASQAPSRSCVLVVRSVRPDADVIAAVREHVARLDASVPIYGVRPMRDVVAASPGMPARRLLSAAFAGFAVLAVVLGAIGLFGVLAHDVASRRAEFALRLALGAEAMDIASATLRQAAVMVGSGVALGGVLSIWAAHALSSAGFAADGIGALSIGLPLAVVTVAAAAAVFPAARRAAHTDPLIALRSD